MAYNPNNPNGQTTAANSQPVVLASDQTAIPITDNAGSITVDGSVSVSNFPATQPVSGTVTADTELPAAASLTDGIANPTTPTIGAANVGFNGTSWDRLKTATSQNGNGAIDETGVLSVKQAAKRLNPTALATATNSASTVDVNGYNTISFAIATTTTGTIIFEGTGDNTNWGSIEVYDIFGDAWVSGTSITPTAGKVYTILCGGLRQVRVRVNATLGATVSHFITLDATSEFLAGIDTGAAPHNFGYTLVHKDGEYTTAQTGTVLWTPTSGKKFAVTDITISVGGTTSGVVTLFDATSATTTYTAGTTPAIFRGAFAPSTSSSPGAIKSFNVPYVSTTANNVVHITTSAAMTVYVQLNGYEI